MHHMNSSFESEFFLEIFTVRHRTLNVSIIDLMYLFAHYLGNKNIRYCYLLINPTLPADYIMISMCCINVVVENNFTEIVFIFNFNMDCTICGK